MGNIGSSLDKKFAHFEVSSTRGIVQWSLSCKFVCVINTFFGGIFPHNIETILADGVEERGLSVDINLVQTESMAQEYLCTLVLSFPADVEEDGLIVIVFVFGVGAVANQQLDELRRTVVRGEQRSEIERGLPKLRF